MEPVLRESIDRLAPEQRLGTDGVVGGYWTRKNDVEIDVVIGDRGPVAKRIQAVGSIKWLENSPFDGHDLAALARHRDQLPGAGGRTPLLAVSRTGSSLAGVHVFGPEALLDAWRQPAAAAVFTESSKAAPKQPRDGSVAEL